MLIRFVEVEDFRGVRGPVKVELGSGINVWHGPNEIGKSTLVEAIRSVLVLPAKSSSDAHKAMATRGGDKAPRVALGFVVDDGTEVSVQKSFGANGKVAVELRRPGASVERLEADRADEALRAMLRVGPASRGSVSDPGPFGLVFVAQGASRANPTVSDSTRALLRDRLAALSSEVIAGPESIELLARARDRYVIHFTDGGAEKSSKDAPLAAARAREKTASEVARALAERRSSLDTIFDDADAAATDLARLARDLPGLEERVRAAREGVDRLGDARRLVEAAEGALERSVLLAERPSEALQARTSLRAASEAANAALEAADRRRRAADAARDAHEATRRELEAASEEAAAALREAEAAAKRSAALVRIRAKERELADVSERHARALEIDGKRKELREIERGIDAELAAAVELAEGQLAQAERRLESASATVRLRMLAPHEVVVDGRPTPVASGSAMALRIASTTTISIDGIASIEIDPGGEELPELRASLDGLRATLARRLADAGATSVEEAREKARARGDASREIAILDRELALVARAGLAALTATKLELEAQLVEACAELGSVVAKESADTSDASDPERALRGAEDEVGRRRGDSTAADAALDRHRERAAGLRVEAATATSELEAEARDRERVARDLADHVERFGSDADLEATVRSLAKAEQDARAVCDRARADLDAMQPDALDRELESTTKALANATRRRVAIETELAVLRARLADGDAIGLDDRLARALADESVAARERATIELDAAAAKLLFETLTRHKNAAEARFRAPLEQKVRDLLALVLGDARLSLDDQTLTVAQLDRGNHRADGFDQLSSGAQEQLGVIVRLAMAELLAGDGVLPVTLDDALVFTDERRFQGMRRVLERVAEHLQIVFVTCQWDRYRALGLVADVEVDLGRLLGDARVGPT